MNPQQAFEKGVARHQAGKFGEAIEYYSRVIELDPQHAEALCNLGIALHELGKFDDAIDAYQRAIAFRPDIAATYNNLGNTLKMKGDPQAAADAYQQALALQPEYADPLYNLANILLDDGQTELAIQFYQGVVALRPDHAQAYNNLGNALKGLGQSEAALSAYQKAISIRPDLPQAHRNAGVLLQSLGQHGAAVEAYQKSFELTPESALAAASLLFAKQSICDWDRIEEWTARVVRSIEISDDREFHEPADPLSFMAMVQPTTAEQQSRCAEKYARYQQQVDGFDRFRRDAVSSTPKPFDRNFEVLHFGEKLPGRRIRIGYFSADFREHAVGHAIVELLESHDRDTFEVFGYSIGPDDQSPIRRRIITAFDCFHDLRRATDDAIADQIKNDQIDILIDLQGHTGETRPKVLTFHPAPVQIGFLGFPGTMGKGFNDFILVDEYIVPRRQQPYFSEKIIHVPGCYMVNDGQRTESQPPPTRSECGLPENAFVFCGFCSSFKITPDIFSLWMRLLHAFPESVLWLQENNSNAKSNLCREALQRGVDPKRLIFAGKVPRRETHLARQRSADLFLDTYPYNCHSTAGDILSLGVPMITLSGDTFASRVAGSLLTAIEMPELITHCFGDYEQLAKRFVADRDELTRVKQKLDKNRLMLSRYSGQPFARNLESIFQSLVGTRSVQ